MRLLYGVVGEGMGHATRARVVMDHLRARGHAVLAAASGRAVGYLQRAGHAVVPIAGLSLRYVDGALDWPGSVGLNAQRLRWSAARTAAAWREVAAFAPQGALTDLDSFACAYAAAAGIAVASVDNHQVMARCVHDPALLAAWRGDLRAAELFVALKTPGCRRYVVASFFGLPVRPAAAATTVLVPPVLRPALLAAAPRAGDHLLVYQSAAGDGRLLAALQALAPRPCVVYGLGRTGVVGNCTLRPFDEDRFVDDLAGAAGVVTNGGFSLLSEAVALGKPVYSVPVRGQVEQVMNAWYLQRLGFGWSRTYVDAASLRAFVAALPALTATLAAAPRHDANAALYRAVDATVATF